MDLLRTEDETMLADAARRMLDEKAPITHLRALREAGRRSDPALWAVMAGAGWAGVLVPEGAGGVDMGHGAAMVLAEEMGRTLAPSPFLSTAVIAVTALKNTGEAGALAAIAEGRETWALALDEGRKFAPEAVAMRAEAAGNGFRLTGEKPFTPDGGTADRLLVLARSSGTVGDLAGLTLFVVDAGAEGVSRDALDTIDGRDAAHLRFDGVEATPLGDVDEGWRLLAPALAAGQAALAAEMTGAAAAVMGTTVAYLKERKQFGVPIGSFQALQHRAAHLWCEAELTASAVLNAARVLDEEGGDSERAELAVSLAKARATGTLQLAVREGVQMHGGIGMTEEYDMGFYMRRARVAAEWLGDYGWHAARVARLRGL